MASLNDPVALAHGPALPNRLMLAPLTNQQSHPDGTLSDDEYRWLTMRAQGGFGLVTTCAAHVQANGQGFPGQLGIFGDLHLPGLTRLASGIAEAGSVGYVQLHHAGNRTPPALIGDTPVSSSDDPDTGARALTTTEVHEAIEAFVNAAVRAQRAGFHGVELHGAHGYLICQFLSPELNRRTDRFGGSLEARSRFLFDIIAGIRAACGDSFGLAVRLSPERFGMQLAEAVQLYEWLVADGGVDLIDMSLWDVNRVPGTEGFEGLSLAEIFTRLPRGAVRLGVAGKIQRPSDAQAMLDLGVDVAIVGRAAIVHHDYAAKAMADRRWEPLTPPVPLDHLLAEGVSPAFAGYLRDTFKMVAD